MMARLLVLAICLLLRSTEDSRRWATADSGLASLSNEPQPGNQSASAGDRQRGLEPAQTSSPKTFKGGWNARIEMGDRIFVPEIISLVDYTNEILQKREKDFTLKAKVYEDGVNLCVVGADFTGSHSHQSTDRISFRNALHFFSRGIIPLMSQSAIKNTLTKAYAIEKASTKDRELEWDLSCKQVRGNDGSPDFRPDFGFHIGVRDQPDSWVHLKYSYIFPAGFGNIGQFMSDGQVQTTDDPNWQDFALRELGGKVQIYDQVTNVALGKASLLKNDTKLWTATEVVAKMTKLKPLLKSVRAVASALFGPGPVKNLVIDESCSGELHLSRPSWYAPFAPEFPFFVLTKAEVAALTSNSIDAALGAKLESMKKTFENAKERPLLGFYPPADQSVTAAEVHARLPNLLPQGMKNPISMPTSLDVVPADIIPFKYEAVLNKLLELRQWASRRELQESGEYEVSIPFNQFSWFEVKHTPTGNTYPLNPLEVENGFAGFYAGGEGVERYLKTCVAVRPMNLKKQNGEDITAHLSIADTDFSSPSFATHLRCSTWKYGLKVTDALLTSLATTEADASEARLLSFAQGSAASKEEMEAVLGKNRGKFTMRTFRASNMVEISNAKGARISFDLSSALRRNISALDLGQVFGYLASRGCFNPLDSHDSVFVDLEIGVAVTAGKTRRALSGLPLSYATRPHSASQPPLPFVGSEAKVDLCDYPPLLLRFMAELRRLGLDRRVECLDSDPIVVKADGGETTAVAGFLPNIVEQLAELKPQEIETANGNIKLLLDAVGIKFNLRPSAPPPPKAVAVPHGLGNHFNAAPPTPRESNAQPGDSLADESELPDETKANPMGGEEGPGEEQPIKLPVKEPEFGKAKQVIVKEKKSLPPPRATPLARPNESKAQLSDATGTYRIALKSIDAPNVITGRKVATTKLPPTEQMAKDDEEPAVKRDPPQGSALPSGFVASTGGMRGFPKKVAVRKRGGFSGPNFVVPVVLAAGAFSVAALTAVRVGGLHRQRRGRRSKPRARPKKVKRPARCRGEGLARKFETDRADLRFAGVESDDMDGSCCMASTDGKLVGKTTTGKEAPDTRNSAGSNCANESGATLLRARACSTSQTELKPSAGDGSTI
eukprot:GHVT01100621.1.p1 GENE.GHVT01100621.1~~GHVT01100621.1.p1  ORF type:complete len:1122 (+),score=220.35 GHVT01100621.1:50-3415(+)